MRGAASTRIVSSERARPASGERPKVSDVSAATGETTHIAGGRRAGATRRKRFISLPHHRFRSVVFYRSRGRCHPLRNCVWRAPNARER